MYLYQSMSRARPIVAAMAVAAAMLAVPAQARADAAGDFLKALAGEFRGRGTAKIPGREQNERIVCQVTNAYDSDAGELVVSGNCASTQAKTAVSGRLAHSGETVSGLLIGSMEGATMTKSSGVVSGGQLVVTTNLVDNATGNLTRTRQVVRLSGKGFTTQFFTYNNRSQQYELNGTMEFSGS